jgi:acyl-homoserine lactone acylase PvdQ
MLALCHHRRRRSWPESMLRSFFSNTKGVMLVGAGAAVALAGCPGSEGSAARATSVFLNVLPPGANGNSAGGSGAIGIVTPQTKWPPHFEDQVALYGDLAQAKPGLMATPCTPPASSSDHQAASQLACNYFKNEGLTPDTVASTETLTAPSGGTVTIQRDAWGVPFISAPTRADAMYGFGWASAEDRLWLYDILRNLGRGRMSAFLGPASGFYAYDANLATVAGYSEDELTGMVADMPAKLGALGTLIVSDIDADVAGMNAYVATLSGANAAKTPREYGILKGGGFPPPAFTANDIVASAILIQSIFAGGGGEEHQNALLLQQLDASVAPGAAAVPDAACRLWRDLRHADDPDATRTIDAEFHPSPARLDETCPHALAAGAALWDPGSFKTRSAFATAPSTGAPLVTMSATVTASEVHRVFPALDPIRGAKAGLRQAGFSLPDRLSNFIAVGADQTADGHPIAVMGPQTSYFVPQMLWEVAIHSGGGTPQDFDGRGVVFGNLPYIEIGRGLGYAWSATSGGSDLTDERVSRMCNLDGSPPSRDDANGDGFPDADGYIFDAGDGHGPKCRRFYERTDSWQATPTLASMGSGGAATAETITRTILRTHYGPVLATATVNGAPVVVSIQRSTFGAELDTSVPFALASAHVVHDAASFQKLFNSCTGSFNWLYVDAKDVGYLHAGLYPLRDAAQDPDLPVWGDGRFEWAADKALPAGYFDAAGGSVPFPKRLIATFTGDPLQGTLEWQGYMPLAQHPQSINPPKGWITSWNNSPAKGWWAADGDGNYGPTHRVDMLAKRLAAFQATGKRFDLANMVEIMADAAYTDLRGQEVLPWLLQAMRAGPLDPTQTEVAALMQAWIDAGSGAWIDGSPGLGAWRRDRDGDGKYDQRQAVVLMDAWYPALIDALLPQITAIDGGGRDTECSGVALQCRYDAPRAQGSAYEYGYYEMMKRVLQMALGTPGHTSYRALACAGSGTSDACRAGVLSALQTALTSLGGWESRASWDGSTLVNAQTGMAGEAVETYDAVEHQSFGMMPVPTIPWVNRPTFQQAVEVR